VIAFTDDDCRPPVEWLERALAAATRAPGAIVQGTTRPDPDELAIAVRAPHARSQTIDPPVPWAQTCNIVYPRALLEDLGGFDETMDGGEDCELAQRAVESGAVLAGAPEVLTFHAVHADGLIGALRSLPRWQHLAGLVARHPALRSSFVARVFWRESHGLLLLGLAGLLMAGGSRGRRRRGAALLVLPWAVRAAPSYGSGLRGRVRAISELPGLAIVDAAEIAVMARGSIRYRTLLL
jgi:GT2 family glycosyltransferase